LSWTQSNGSGTLTVTSGTKVETLTLLGQYSLADFSASSDGHGGTLITDPVPAALVIGPTTSMTVAHS
jgi:hypothetical protein